MSNTFYAELGEATVALLKAKMSLHNEKVKGNIISKHLRAIANCLDTDDEDLDDTRLLHGFQNNETSYAFIGRHQIENPSTSSEGNPVFDVPGDLVEVIQNIIRLEKTVEEKEEEVRIATENAMRR